MKIEVGNNKKLDILVIFPIFMLGDILNKYKTQEISIGRAKTGTFKIPTSLAN